MKSQVRHVGKSLTFLQKMIISSLFLMQNQAPDIFEFMSQDPLTPLKVVKQGFLPFFEPNTKSQVRHVGKSLTFLQKMNMSALFLMQNQAPSIFEFMSQDPPTPLNRAKQGFYSCFGPLAQNQVGKVGKSFSTVGKILVQDFHKG